MHKILIDECIDRRFKNGFITLEAHTVHEMGWSGLSNGALLGKAESEKFTVFITADKQIRHQQNISGYRIAIIIIQAYRNTLKSILPLVPEIIQHIDEYQPGRVYEVG